MSFTSNEKDFNSLVEVLEQQQRQNIGKVKTKNNTSDYSYSNQNNLRSDNAAIDFLIQDSINILFDDASFLYPFYQQFYEDFNLQNQQPLSDHGTNSHNNSDNNAKQPLTDLSKSNSNTPKFKGTQSFGRALSNKLKGKSASKSLNYSKEKEVSQELPGETHKNGKQEANKVYKEIEQQQKSLMKYNKSQTSSRSKSGPLYQNNNKNTNSTTIENNNSDQYTKINMQQRSQSANNNEGKKGNSQVPSIGQVHEKLRNQKAQQNDTTLSNQKHTNDDLTIQKSSKQPNGEHQAQPLKATEMSMDSPKQSLSQSFFISRETKSKSSSLASGDKATKKKNAFSFISKMFNKSGKDKSFDSREYSSGTVDQTFNSKDKSYQDQSTDKRSGKSSKQHQQTKANQKSSAKDKRKENSQKLLDFNTDKNKSFFDDVQQNNDAFEKPYQHSPKQSAKDKNFSSQSIYNTDPNQLIPYPANSRIFKRFNISIQKSTQHNSSTNDKIKKEQQPSWQGTDNDKETESSGYDNNYSNGFNKEALQSNTIVNSSNNNRDISELISSLNIDQVDLKEDKVKLASKFLPDSSLHEQAKSPKSLYNNSDLQKPFSVVNENKQVPDKKIDQGPEDQQSIQQISNNILKQFEKKDSNSDNNSDNNSVQQYEENSNDRFYKLVTTSQFGSLKNKSDVKADESRSIKNRDPKEKEKDVIYVAVDTIGLNGKPKKEIMKWRAQDLKKMSLDEMRVEKKALKSLLKAIDGIMQNIKQQPLSKDDKRHMKPLYMRYWALKKLIKKKEIQMENGPQRDNSDILQKDQAYLDQSDKPLGQFDDLDEDEKIYRKT